MRNKVANFAVWMMGSGLVLLCVPDWAARANIIILCASTIIIAAWALIVVGFVAAGISFFLEEKERKVNE